MITIDLSWSEVHQAAQTGTNRCLNALRKGLKDAHGYEGFGFDISIQGALGEIALAKYLNVYWDQYNSKRETWYEGDVGSFEVRTIRKRHHNLTLHQRDRDNRAYILACAEPPTVLLLGWIMGKDGKLEKYWTEPQKGRPCFLFPRNKLKPMGELKR